MAADKTLIAVTASLVVLSMLLTAPAQSEQEDAERYYLGSGYTGVPQVGGLISCVPNQEFDVGGVCHLPLDPSTTVLVQIEDQVAHKVIFSYFVHDLEDDQPYQGSCLHGAAQDQIQIVVDGECRTPSLRVLTGHTATFGRVRVTPIT